MKKIIKNYLKRNQVLAAMYKRVSWLREVPIKDYLNIMKIGLIFKVKPW